MLSSQGNIFSSEESPKMIKQIWNLLGSVQLVIPLLIVITFVSLIGIVVPQGAIPPDFHQQGLRASIIAYLGLNQVFTSWWFYSLLGLLSINVVACSVSHQFKSVGRALRPHFLKTDGETAHLKSSTQFSVDRDVSGLASTVSAYFKKRFYFVAEQKADNTFQIATRSFFFKEIGSLLFHFSILFFFAGGVIGSLQGYSLVKEFRAGDVAVLPQWPFLMRCDWFKVEKNNDGSISDYKSKMTVLSRDSAVLFSKIIQVNHPLSYQGLSFYQNSYGELPDRIDEAVIRVTGAGIDTPGTVLTVPLNAATPLPGKNLSITLRRFVGDFVIGADNREVFSRSGKPNNPAIKIEILRGSDTLFDNWSFLNYPEVHQENKQGYKIAFLDYAPQYYTGIKVSKNPGNVFIWLGFALMTMGILLVFYFPHKSFWIFVEASGASSSRVIAGGSSSGSLSAFQDEFKHVFDALQSHSKKGP
jgi:cytochrome c biogenesis protein